MYLRKEYAKLIVYLFYLMIDSGIKDMSEEALEKLVEKFCLNESDEAAEKHFLGILEESVNALFAVISDRIHVWAGYFRKWSWFLQSAEDEYFSIGFLYFFFLIFYFIKLIRSYKINNNNIIYIDNIF